MAVQFNVPAGPEINVWKCDYFKGVDLNNAASNVENNRSPEAPNMIRDEVGKVRKRMGWKTVETLQGQINGHFVLKDTELLHAGTKLLRRGSGDTAWTEVYTDMADRRSVGLVFGDALYLLDGKTYLKFDGTTASKVTDSAKVPTVIISRRPSGGGTSYEPLNLCSRGWTESFLSDGTSKEYQLTTDNLAADLVKAEQLNADGTWKTLQEGTDFTVNRTMGKVTFASAIPQSPVSGGDNLHITAYKDREGYAGRINKMQIAALFGVNGAPDRIFAAGNPEYPNIDYYSELNDPTFFGDTSYANIGQSDARIVGYSIVGNYLATHKASGADGRNVIIRAGTVDSTGAAQFQIVNTLKGEGAVSQYAFQSLKNEPLFLTQSGIYGITTGELTGERINELRSLHISEAIQAIAQKEECVAWIWRDFYFLSAGSGDVYVLDGMQKEYSKDAPWSNYQYECYKLTHIPARIWWDDGETLWFGMGDGRLCRFYTDVDDPKSYNDDGAAIEAYWDTPDISGKLFYKNKTFRNLSLLIAAAPVTGCRVRVQKKGIWSQVYTSGEKARYFDWNYVDFSKFVFSADRTPHTLSGKIKVKKVDKCRFRIQNFELNEPFGLYAFATEYTQARNNYKG